MNRSHLQHRAEGFAIGGVRILAALMWIANLHWKVPGDFGEKNGGGLYKYIASGAENAPFAPFRWVLREVVVPNFSAFGWFTLVSETIVAALLLIGYRTRLVALTGAMLAVPIGLSVIYYPKADEWSWSYLMMIGLHLLIAANSSSSEHLSVDGALSGGMQRRLGGLRALGGVGVVVGVLGLIVARSADFAGEGVKLLGSDAGFVDGDKLVRRMELKFVWFNPLWAILTILLGALLIVGARRVQVALAGGIGFGVLAVIAFVQGTWNYLRDDGAVQKISTGSNVALWGGLAVGALVLARSISRDSDSPAVTADA